MTDRRLGTVEGERARAYADATNDHNPAYREGRCAPPVFGVVPTWDSLLGALDELVPPESLPMLLHTEQDMRFHRPLVRGVTLSTVAEPYSVRVTRLGTWITVRLASDDGAGRPVLEQFSTMFVRGMTGGEDFGPDRPTHAFPADARSRPLVESVRRVDEDQTFRYRDASGDTNPIHVDEELARQAGLPGIIVHGLCTMAMCGSVVVDQVAARDPARLARLAVRFSRPVFPGDDLVVSVYDAGQGAYAFEATARDKLVVRDGWAEVRS